MGGSGSKAGSDTAAATAGATSSRTNSVPTGSGSATNATAKLIYFVRSDRFVCVLFVCVCVCMCVCMCVYVCVCVCVCVMCVYVCVLCVMGVCCADTRSLNTTSSCDSARRGYRARGARRRLMTHDCRLQVRHCACVCVC